MRSDEIRVPLGIKDVDVLKVELEGETLHIEVESSLGYAGCEQYGRKIVKFDGYGEWVSVQHLPSFGGQVYVHYRPKREQGPYCENHPTTRQQVQWHEPHSPHTKAY